MMLFGVITKYQKSMLRQGFSDGKGRTCFRASVRSYNFFSREWQMRMAGAPHHTNPRSATLDFWRKTTPYDQYKIIQAKRRKQMNMPTSSGLNKEDHLGKI